MKEGTGQGQHQRNFNEMYSYVVRKALLVKAPPRGVVRRLSMVLDYDCAPDSRGCRYFRWCSYGSCDSSVSIELMKVKNNVWISVLLIYSY